MLHTACVTQEIISPMERCEMDSRLDAVVKCISLDDIQNIETNQTKALKTANFNLNCIFSKKALTRNVSNRIN